MCKRPVWVQTRELRPSPIAALLRPWSSVCTQFCLIFRFHRQPSCRSYFLLFQEPRLWSDPSPGMNSIAAEKCTFITKFSNQMAVMSAIREHLFSFPLKVPETYEISYLPPLSIASLLKFTSSLLFFFATFLACVRMTLWNGCRTQVVHTLPGERIAAYPFLDSAQTHKCLFPDAQIMQCLYDYREWTRFWSQCGMPHLRRQKNLVYGDFTCRCRPLCVWYSWIIALRMNFSKSPHS